MVPHLRRPERSEGPHACYARRPCRDARSFAALRTTVKAFPSIGRLLDGNGPELGPMVFFGCLLNTASAASGDLWCLRRIRLAGVGRNRRADLRRVLELALVALRHRLERREILAAHRRAHRELLRERIHGMAGAIELVVQVRTGRHAGSADEADHLALAHRDTGLDAGT